MAAGASLVEALVGAYLSSYMSCDSSFLKKRLASLHLQANGWSLTSHVLALLPMLILVSCGVALVAHNLLPSLPVS